MVTVTYTTWPRAKIVSLVILLSGSSARGGSGILNNCCGVGDGFVSDGVGISRGNVDGAVHGVTDYEDGVAPEVDVDGVNPRSVGGMGNQCLYVIDRFLRDGVDISNDKRDEGVQRGVEYKYDIARENGVYRAGASSGDRRVNY